MFARVVVVVAVVVFAVAVPAAQKIMPPSPPSPPRPTSPAKWILVTVVSEFVEPLPSTEGEPHFRESIQTGPRFIATDTIIEVEPTGTGSGSAIRTLPLRENSDYFLFFIVEEGPKALCRVLNCLDATPPEETGDAPRGL